ncbi:uncharacterized protein (DUF1810 family) [Mesorhizobium soli]|jgi:uncharacterized protein (DUF1810 family)|uniref:DUF1810 domain-containing protein n=1 Tax=Pseudaminobacter soli (ex Li et al. 2025) TaxID=1295366 RepID=UPI002473A44F|nr:DUF1810 domain-containing protein [Mesorhizobium soli]MDH6232667.1 uncharacterized protein (DUF1810 family) [Mesorhizobium soli]
MTDPADPFDLVRFVSAQDPVIAEVCAELKHGRKTSHWMWFVFPQVAGLGMSAMSQRYAIGSLGEARAYLEHPVLGPRLRLCVGLLLEIKGRSAHEIFGSPDDRKLRSSLTLFEQAASEDPIFRQALDRYFGGIADQATLERLRT